MRCKFELANWKTPRYQHSMQTMHFYNILARSNNRAAISTTSSHFSRQTFFTALFPLCRPAHYLNTHLIGALPLQRQSSPPFFSPCTTVLHLFAVAVTVTVTYSRRSFFRDFSTAPWSSRVWVRAVLSRPAPSSTTSQLSARTARARFASRTIFHLSIHVRRMPRVASLPVLCAALPCLPRTLVNLWTTPWPRTLTAGARAANGPTPCARTTAATYVTSRPHAVTHAVKSSVSNIACKLIMNARYWESNHPRPTRSTSSSRRTR